MTSKTLTPLGGAIGECSPFEPLLIINKLCVDTRGPGGPVRLVDQFDLTLYHGKPDRLVGESGSGKSVTARALMRLNQDLDTSGSVRLEGTELLTLSRREMTTVRGRRIGMVFQDPMEALNPLQSIGQQVAEPCGYTEFPASGLKKCLCALLDELGVPRARERMRAYPHEFSGGMRQRVVLAMALIGDPDLLIADEPTTALDVRVQAQVMALLTSVQQQRDLTVLLITHDFALVAGFAQRVIVMYTGRIVEERPVLSIFREPGPPIHLRLDPRCPAHRPPTSET